MDLAGGFGHTWPAGFWGLGSRISFAIWRVVDGGRAGAAGVGGLVGGSGVEFSSCFSWCLGVPLARCLPLFLS